MRITRAVRLSLILVIAALLPASPLPAATAQVETPTVDTSLILEAPLTLPQGKRTWVAIYRASLSDDDPPIDGREGVLYAFDAPLVVLHEEASRVDRVPQGKAVALHEDEQVKPVAMQDGPASLLAAGLADPETIADGDAWQPVGEPFDVPAGDSIVRLHRYDLSARSDRIVKQLQAQIAALPYPAMLFVEQGEVIATPVGEDAAATVQSHQMIAADATSGLAVSDDGAVILLLTLEPAGSIATSSLPGTSSQSAGTGPTPAMPPTSQPSGGPTATTVPTMVSTVAPVDTDGDGLSDADEAARGTDPANRDSDGDGVFDGAEVAAGYDPLKQDTDGDGVSDYDEYGADAPEPGAGDADGDGLTDGYEGQVSLTDPYDFDSDDDGLSDGDEVARGSNPLNRDTDGDGLTDGTDVAYGASPLSPDTDRDGLSDRFEINQGTSPASVDTDGDGVDDGYETGRGMNPLLADTDGDGLGDGDELATYGTNPTNIDSDGDCLGDGVEIRIGSNPFAPDTDGDGDDDNREYQAYLDTGYPYPTDPDLSLTDGPSPPCHLQ